MRVYICIYFRKNFKMGCCLSRNGGRRCYGNLKPNARLVKIINNANPTTEYLHWHDCVGDLLDSYNHHLYHIRMDVNIIVFFKCGATQQIVHSIPYYGNINIGTFRFLRTELYAFMVAPYIYINHRIHFLDNVYSTKFNCIKTFWIL